jgi:hypothetical protein
MSGPTAISPPVYALGIVLAIVGAAVNNLGVVFQKKAINALPVGKKVTRHLLKNRLWFSGFIMNNYLPMAFSFPALWFIGSTLEVGLEASGLIILALGSIRILKEKIKISEMVGILLLLFAMVCLVYANLGIDTESYPLGDTAFLVRVFVFTAIVVAGSFMLLLLRRRSERYVGVLNALDSGLMWVINNFWITPFLVVLVRVLILQSYVTNELILFVCGAGVLVITSFLAVYRLQKSFETGQAANMRPIQQAPVQIALIFYYLAIFMLPLPIESLLLAIAGFGLILVSFYLLSRRQARLAAIE